MKPGSLAVTLLGFYQKHLSAFKPPCCRFQPSCSEYARQAISKYGLMRGAYRSALRVLRCHPLSGSFGYDPVD